MALVIIITPGMVITTTPELLRGAMGCIITPILVGVLQLVLVMAGCAGVFTLIEGAIGAAVVIAEATGMDIEGAIIAVAMPDTEQVIMPVDAIQVVMSTIIGIRE